MSSTRETGRPVLNATRARQGRWGQHVFWVLVFGTLLAALGLFAAWTWRADEVVPTKPGSSVSAAPSDTRPAPVPASSPTPTTP